MPALRRGLLFPLFAAVFAVGAWAPGGQAHSPRFKCHADGEKFVVCEGGFSDGSDAVGAPIQVLSYDDEPLWEGKLDEKAQVRFERPSSDFYVRFDGGEGHTAEVDQSEIP